jgi:hypothetical protein
MPVRTSEDVMPVFARRSFLIGAALAPLAPALAHAQASGTQASGTQAWPTRPVTLIIPFPAGGAMDLLGRSVAQDLTDKLGQQFVVDNRAGAAGNIGAMAAAKAPPDGYTILMAGAASLALNKFMFSNMPYDPETELTPIVIVSRLPHIFVVNAKVEAKTLKELVDYAKANPGKLSAGVPGIGTTAHITLEAFMAETGAKMTVVPYRAEPQMLTDLVGGQLDFACTLTTSPGRTSSRKVARACRDQRHPHAAIARCPHGGAGGLPRLRSHRLVCAGRTHRDAGGHYCEDQYHAQRLHSQCEGQGGIEQARLAAGRRHARGNESLHRRRSPQMGAHHQGGKDSDVAHTLSRAQPHAARTCEAPRRKRWNLHPQASRERSTAAAGQ